MTVWGALRAGLTTALAVVVWAQDTNFSGTLVRVGSGSISIRLADHRIIDAVVANSGRMAPEALAARFRMGDQVELECHSIAPVWEEGTSRYQTLQATDLKLARRPAAEELGVLLGTTPFREGKNLLERPALPPPAPSQAPNVDAPGGRELADARRVNLEYAANMPNFIADEKARRWRRAPGSTSWRDFDTVESEIAFKGNRASRRGIRRNGKAWTQPFEGLPGFKWYEGFGTEITPLFDAKCPTTITYADRSKIGGRAVVEYEFSAPVDSCFPLFFFGYQRFNPARSGQFAIDETGGNILRLDEDASAFPAEMQFADREEHISWDRVTIAGESHLLPVKANFLVRYYDGTQYKIEVEYKNHRHFEASTNVTFH